MYKVYRHFNFPFVSLVETWKDIPDWESCYQVSSFGNVRSKNKIREKTRLGKATPAFYAGKIMKQKTNASGYKVIGFKDLERISHPSVHRLLALSFIPNPDNKPTVNHIDGDKQNNHISNLEWSTFSEQTLHAIDNGLIIPRGAPIYSPEFKSRVYDYFIKNNCSIRELSRVFNLSQKTASDISKGKINRQGLKLPDSAVKEIIQLRDNGWTLEKIANHFDCGISQIHRITKGFSRNIKYERY